MTRAATPTGSPRWRVFPATADRFDDVAAILGPADPTSPACWCLSMRLSNAENRALDPAERSGRLRRFALDGTPPGVLAYAGSTPAGWCSVAPRSSYHRLTHSRTIPAVDDVAVWSIVCLVIRPQFRRQGLSRVLLRGAVDHAFAAGAPAVEAYPVEAAGFRIDGTAAYVGILSTFASEGFERIAPTNAVSAGRPRILMRRHPDGG